MDKKRIGIMGGTFDPIHMGHLVIAEAVREAYELDEVLFIPACSPPHKPGIKVAPVLHRYVMTVLATAGHPAFSVSPLEMNRPGPSYSYDTVLALQEEMGEDCEFFFILGSDAVKELSTWHNIDQLLSLCHFVAATRPGFSRTVEAVVSQFGEKGKERIHHLATPELAISATDIRNRIQAGRSVRFILPEPVEAYIKKEGLYR